MSFRSVTYFFNISGGRKTVSCDFGAKRRINGNNDFKHQDGSSVATLKRSLFSDSGGNLYHWGLSLDFLLHETKTISWKSLRSRSPHKHKQINNTKTELQVSLGLQWQTKKSAGHYEGLIESVIEGGVYAFSRLGDASYRPIQRVQPIPYVYS